jgi:hypothetical protein
LFDKVSDVSVKLTVENRVAGQTDVQSVRKVWNQGNFNYFSYIYLQVKVKALMAKNSINIG